RSRPTKDEQVPLQYSDSSPEAVDRPTMSQNKKLRNAIVAILQAGHGVDMRADLSVYPSEGSFLVECFLGDEQLDLTGLNPDQTEQAVETGEIAEYLPTAEEAADCYLLLCEWLEKALLANTGKLPPLTVKPRKDAPEPGVFRDLSALD